MSAFRSSAEADLVDNLRSDGDVMFSVVAEAGNAVLGHAMLSRMRTPFRALGLAPVSVVPAWQRKGIGKRMIRELLALADNGLWDAIFVLGDPSYYEPLGFCARAARGFQSPYAGPHLMVFPIRGRLPTSKGKIDYAPAFAALG